MRRVQEASRCREEFDYFPLPEDLVHPLEALLPLGDAEGEAEYDGAVPGVAAGHAEIRAPLRPRQQIASCVQPVRDHAPQRVPLRRPLHQRSPAPRRPTVVPLQRRAHQPHPAAGHVQLVSVRSFLRDGLLSACESRV